MAKSLFINRVALNPPKGKVDVTFRAGLNVIRAILTNTSDKSNKSQDETGNVNDPTVKVSVNQPGTRNSVGKTTFVHLLDYGLGKSTFLSKDKAYGRKVLQSHDVLMELRIHDKEYTVQRNLVNGETCYLYEGWVINQLLEGKQLLYKTLSIEDYRNFLEEELFKAANVYEDSKFVSYRDVMQIIFRDQVGGFESIDKPGNYYAKANDKRKLLEFLSGLATSETLGVDKRVSDAEELEKEAKKALDIIKKYVNYKVNQAEELIREEVLKVEKEINSKIAEISELKQRLVLLQKESDKRTERKEMLIRRKQTLIKEEQIVKLRLNSFQATLNEIETENSHLDTAYHAQQLLDSYEYDKCPVCLIPITNNSSITCPRKADDCDSNSFQSMEAMKKILANEKDDLTKTIKKLSETINNLQIAIRELDEKIEEINEEIYTDANHILSKLNICEDELRVLLKKQMGLKQDLEYFKDHEEYKKRYDIAKNNLLSVKADRNRIQQKMEDSLESLKVFFHGAVSYLYFANRIGVLNLSKRARNFQAEIRYLLTSEGRDTGAAAITLTVIAFDLALLKLALEQDTPHPKLLVHDSPNIRDIEPLVYDRIFTYITEQLEKPFIDEGKEPDFQYIITTIAMPEQLAIDPYIRLELNNNGDDGKLFEFTF